MAPGGDIQRRRKDCLDMAVRAGGDPDDVVRRARDFEAYLTDPNETMSPAVEELIGAAQAACDAEEGWGLRLRAALQQLGADG